MRAKASFRRRAGFDRVAIGHWDSRLSARFAGKARSHRCTDLSPRRVWVIEPKARGGVTSSRSQLSASSSLYQTISSGTVNSV